MKCPQCCELLGNTDAERLNSNLKSAGPPKKMSNSPSTVEIQELNIDMVPPVTHRIQDPNYHGGTKLVVVGKPGTGKSTLIKALLHAKKHIFPVGIAMSGSEDTNRAYQEIMPSTFIFNEYDEDKLKDFIRRQKLAQRHLANPWAVLILDDCTDDPKIFNKPLQQALYKKGRHWKMLYILSLQYAMDVKPVIRTNVDGIFILREPLLKNRESLYRNYASIIPDFTTFCDLMDQLTNDYMALYIHGATQTNRWQDCVFYWKAPLPPTGWKFGCEEYWEFHEARFNKDHTESMAAF